jgi:hypothetical protein
MNKSLSLALSLLLASTAWLGCTDVETTTVTRENRVPAQHVSLVYMIAENNLSNNALLDLYEMRDGAADIPENGRLYVFMDRTSQPSILLEVRNTQKVDTVYSWSDNLNSASTEVMKEVFDKVDELAPATSWSLTLWSHGSGWRPNTRSAAARSYGYDKGGPIKDMSMNELAETLKGWHHLDFLFFDACFMQCIEGDYELRETADYILGSPAEIPFNGAPYQSILGDIFAQPFPDVDALLQHYQAEYAVDGVLLSACRTEYLDTLLEATRPYLERCFGGATTNATFSGVQQYYPTYPSGTVHPPYYDLRSFLYAQTLEEGESLDAWDEVLNLAFPYRYSHTRWVTSYSGSNVTGWSTKYDYMIDEAHYGGVSFYTPNVQLWNTDFRTTSWYTAMGWNDWGW